ncbi:MAG: hypothetical protein ACYTFW_12500 [Planctomycetota bacterium]|jgi:hypothetical protein
MKIKWAFFATLVAFFVLATNSNSVAVSTRQVDEILKKGVLDSEDLKIIDVFLAEAVRELIRTRDFTSIAQVRTVILSRRSTQGQYAQQFSESALKHIQEGFKQAETLRPEDRKTKVIINLLILIDGLQDLRLRDLAIGMLKDQNMVVRYWAVHCLTNPAILQQLNSETASNPTTAQTIAEQFKEIVETSSPEIIAMIVRFAANVNIPQGEELLLQIADLRIKRYADWTVKFELLDVSILKLLESKIPLSPQPLGGPTSSKPAIARRFAQLYSYAIQRYIKGQEILNNTQKQHLASVLVEIEEKCIGRLLDRPQLTIRRAIERKNMTAILDEHNRLLGDETTPGQLPAKFGFDYTTSTTGPKRTSPIPLDPPTKTVIPNTPE